MVYQTRKRSSSLSPVEYLFIQITLIPLDVISQPRLFLSFGSVPFVTLDGLIAAVNYELLPEVIKNASESHPEDECQYQANA